MFELKPISQTSIPEALQKAERYRFLNEPQLAESICHDILNIEPDNRLAIITLILSISDQLGRYPSVHMNAAKELIPLLSNDYEKNYYTGIIYERQGKAILTRGMIGDDYAAYDVLMEAMNYFEKAESIRPAGLDDALLRWNTCARLIMSHDLHQRTEEKFEPMLE
ncbi:MAG: hypothetical protein M3Q56_09580 [Bacteroidota bacterium]|nr:hypothetical protein [Bacteroidota bacterium]